MTSELVRAISNQEAKQMLLTGRTVTEVTTTDATPVIGLTIPLDDYTAGFMEFEVIAMDEGGTGKLSGKQIIGLLKTTTLTLDTPNILHDEDILTASWQVINDGENPAVELTGVAATNILWRIRPVNEFLMTIIPVAP